ncbi:serine hydrolase [Luteitalea sp.]|uniref:serine hydrolase domain-containing protein n=1 Tax=Luteitalea sp. TaxID=2004800 RepID=UPI0025BCEC0C|nr:serine hydrolase domain-containing protein [Luteitalea sp.]
MSMRVCRILAALFVATLLLALSPAWATAEDARVDAFVRAQMTARHIPGLTLAVVKHGEVVLQRGYGLANVEDGRLSLETPLRAVLPDMPAAWGPVTIAQLLTHTSGIPSYTSAPAFAGTMRKDYTPTELIALVKDLPATTSARRSRMRPGRCWCPCGT